MIINNNVLQKYYTSFLYKFKQKIRLTYNFYYNKV